MCKADLILTVSNTIEFSISFEVSEVKSESPCDVTLSLTVSHALNPSLLIDKIECKSLPIVGGGSYINMDIGKLYI